MDTGTLKETGWWDWICIFHCVDFPSRRRIMLLNQRFFLDQTMNIQHTRDRVSEWKLCRRRHSRAMTPPLLITVVNFEAIHAAGYGEIPASTTIWCNQQTTTTIEWDVLIKTTGNFRSAERNCYSLSLEFRIEISFATSLRVMHKTHSGKLQVNLHTTFDFQSKESTFLD